MRTILLLFAVYPLISLGAQFQNDRLQHSIHQVAENSPVHQGLIGIQFTCDHALGLESIRAPIHYRAQPGSGTFEYFYQKVGNDPSLPTIVFLPGGPGGSSIGYPLRISGANIIFIDPRGTGCNYANEEDFEWRDVSTDSMINDVVAVIKKERLKHVILYGESYGTVAATQLASKLKNLGQSPDLVVLDGVLGKAHGKWKSYSESFENIGNKFLSEYPQIKALFSSPHLPLGLSNEFWSFYLSDVGNHWEEAKGKLQILTNPNSSAYAETRAEFEDLARNSIPSQKFLDLPSFFVLKSIMCSELSFDFRELSPNTARNIVELENGTLKINDSKYNKVKDECGPEYTYDPYDSKLYQIDAPIVYFEGEEDPQTTYESAIYHYQEQTKSLKKKFYKVSHAGHIVLGGDLYPCSPAIWQKLLAGNLDLSDVLDGDGHCLMKNESSQPILKTANNPSNLLKKAPSPGFGNERPMSVHTRRAGSTARSAPFPCSGNK